MTTEKIAELKELEQKATEANWHVDGPLDDEAEGGSSLWFDLMGGGHSVAHLALMARPEHQHANNVKADADLIVALRNHARELIASAEELERHHEVNKVSCSKALVCLAGARRCTPEETYGRDVTWAISDLVAAVDAFAEDRDVLRALLSRAEKSMEAALRTLHKGRSSWGGNDSAIESLERDLAVIKEALKSP